MKKLFKIFNFDQIGSNLLNRSCLNIISKSYTNEAPSEPAQNNEKAPIDSEPAKKINKKTIFETHPFGIAKANPM